MTVTVRDATFDVLRRLELTTIFSNPGSTEVPFLAGLPEDLTFVLALHEGSVVSMAAGYALGRGAPALALLHSTPGLGNAVAAIATARTNRAPLVVIVGQQDRRHLAQDPFLAGRLDGLAGEYPVYTDQPARAQDVPGAIVRAYHEAVTGRGPALVIVPMDDWTARGARAARDARPAAAAALAGRRPGRGRRAGGAARRRSPRSSPARARTGTALDRRSPSGSNCPVFQEPFGGAAGFPQDHPLFAGHLPARRARLRETLAPYDAVLVVGTGALRQYPYDEGPLVNPGTRLAVVTQDPEEAHRSPVELAVLGDPGAVCLALAEVVEPRLGRHRERSVPAPPRAGRAAARRPRPARARRAPPARRDPARGDAVAAARSCTPASRPRRRSASSARWGCSASRCRPRSACGWRGPTARS